MSSVVPSPYFGAKSAASITSIAAAKTTMITPITRGFSRPSERSFEVDCGFSTKTLLFLLPSFGASSVTWTSRAQWRKSRVDTLEYCSAHSLLAVRSCISLQPCLCAIIGQNDLLYERMPDHVDVCELDHLDAFDSF